MEHRPISLPRQQDIFHPTAYVSDPSNFGIGPTLRTLLRRCVECADQVPSCPKCKSGETCIQVTGGCDSCAQNKCVPQSEAGISQTSLKKDDGGPNIGAIAGGVIGGILFIALATYLIWRFFVRGRRHEVDSMYAEDYDPYGEKSPQTEYTPSADARHSTHSVRSMASTVMTRASNVIQIAFIPGITDRGHGGADEDIPPVPAIPLRQSSPSSTHPPTPYEDHHPGTPYSDGTHRSASTPHLGEPSANQEHYFLPSDLQHPQAFRTDDRYSSAFSDDTSVPGNSIHQPDTRVQSMASSFARDSFASTAYGGHDNHVSVHGAMPAVTALRGRANMVSVRPSPSSASTHTGYNASGGPGTIPEVPSVDYLKYEGNGDTHKEVDTDNASGQAHDDARSGKSGKSGSSGGKGNGSGSSTKAPSSGKASSKMLAQAIHEATRRASRQPTHGGLGSLSPRKDKDSPFSDINAVKES